MEEIKENVQLEENSPAEETIEEMLNCYYESVLEQTKIPKKELVKIFISGFVGGCSGMLVNIWMKPLSVVIPGVPSAVSTIINKVGQYGIGSVVTSKVMSNTKEGLDGIEACFELRKAKSAAKKRLLESKKKQKEE